jgi:hypothetical protein
LTHMLLPYWRKLYVESGFGDLGVRQVRGKQVV